MRRSILTILVIAAVAAALAIPATTMAFTPICVAKTGSDTTGDGSATNPYLTIGKAVSTAVLGSVVSVGPGTYNEDVTITVPMEITGAGAGTTVILGTGLQSVVTVQPLLGGGASLDKLTVTGGSAPSGGGVSSAATLTLTNVSVIQNAAVSGGSGGGVYVFGGAFTSHNSTYGQNTALLGGGGGLYVNGGDVSLDGDTFTGNEAGNGGNVEVIGSGTDIIHDCMIEAGLASGGSYGGLYAQATTITLDGCDIGDNIASSGGGGNLSAFGGRADVIGCTVHDNIGSPMAGLGVQGSAMSVRKSRFTDNIGWMQAGGLDVAGDGDVTDCLFEGNVAMNGSAIFDEHSNITVKNDTIVGNRGSSSSHYAAVICQGVQGITVSNSIFWNNRGNEVTASSLNVTYSDLQHPVAGAGNISADPLFQDAAGGDYELSNGSPCIDTGEAAGSPADDLIGIPRPLDGDNNGSAAYDMGCFERPFMAVAANAASTANAATTLNTGTFGALQMRVDVGTGWSAWGPFSASKAIHLPGEDGTKVVRAQYTYGTGGTISLVDSIVLARPSWVLSKPTVKPTSFRRGGKVAITGTVSPLATVTKVMIYRRVGAALVLAKAITAKDIRVTSAKSRYATAWKATRAGRYVVKAFQATTDRRKATWSAAAAFTVK